MPNAADETAVVQNHAAPTRPALRPLAPRLIALTLPALRVAAAKADAHGVGGVTTSLRAIMPRYQSNDPSLWKMSHPAVVRSRPLTTTATRHRNAAAHDAVRAAKGLMGAMK